MSHKLEVGNEAAEVVAYMVFDHYGACLGPYRFRPEQIQEMERRGHVLKPLIYAALSGTTAPTKPDERQPIPDADFTDTVQAMFSAIGYTEEYALQWPNEKASVTFLRFLVERGFQPGSPTANPSGQIEKDLVAAPTKGEARDAERLDWLEQRQIGVYPVTQLVRDPCTTVDGPRYIERQEHVGWTANTNLQDSPTIREAIDAAMQKQ
jgi:hypothetical protein